MNYTVAKVFNNNVVLANEPDGHQVVLIGKGIGFGARKGDPIDGDDSGSKVFSILNDNISPNDFKRLNYDIDKVEQVTREIVAIARERLDITNDKLYEALLDHVTFAIERLKMGLPIDNPFIGEISIMCAKEYAVAQAAAQLIREQLDVDIGDAEKGFIALHLYSARRNKPLNTAMRGARFFKQAIVLVGEQFGRTFRAESSAAKTFLATLNQLVNASLRSAPLNMPVKQYVRVGLGEQYRCALKISSLMHRELGTQLSEDAIAYLAVAVSLFLQS